MTGLFSHTWRGRPYLLSPIADVLMSGGLALIAVVLMAFFIPYHKNTADDVIPAAYLAAGMYWLAYAVNYPHFMVSYQLLYANFPARLARLRAKRSMWWRTLSAGILVPLALLGLLIITFQQAAAGDNSLMGICLQLMFFFVGWHYAKQAFGVFMVLSALKGIFYTSPQRRALVVNAYAVWLASWVYMSVTSQFLGVAFQQGAAASEGNIFGYRAFELPDFIRIPLLITACASTLSAAWVIFSQWKASGVRPSITALIGYTSMYYLWAFVAVLHPEWALAAPFFHSLQYLMFVNAFKRGETHARLRNAGEADAMAELRLARRLRNRRQEYFGLAFLLGILVFNVIPYQLSNAYGQDVPLDVFVLMFVIFINIHHYFIDNVIWRKENPEVGANLIGWRKALAAAPKTA